MAVDQKAGLMAVEKMIMFIVEDSTTLFIYWQTGHYANPSDTDKANLTVTLIMAAGAMCSALYYGVGFLYLLFTLGYVDCNNNCIVAMGSTFILIPLSIFAPILTAFWICFATLHVKEGDVCLTVGDSVNCSNVPMDNAVHFMYVASWIWVLPASFVIATRGTLK